MLNNEQLFVKVKCARTHFNILKKKKKNTLFECQGIMRESTSWGHYFTSPFAQFSADQRRGERTTRFSGCKGG